MDAVFPRIVRTWSHCLYLAWSLLGVRFNTIQPIDQHAEHTSTIKFYLKVAVLVTIYTDHTPVLEKPNSSGNHARWWSKVYSSGIELVCINYQSGHENCNADALSRHPLTNPHVMMKVRCR